MSMKGSHNPQISKSTSKPSVCNLKTGLNWQVYEWAIIFVITYKLSAKDSHTMHKIWKEHENDTGKRVHLDLSIQQINKKQNIPNSGLEFVDKFLI